MRLAVRVVPDIETVARRRGGGLDLCRSHPVAVSGGPLRRLAAGRGGAFVRIRVGEGVADRPGMPPLVARDGPPAGAREFWCGVLVRGNGRRSQSASGFSASGLCGQRPPVRRARGVEGCREPPSAKAGGCSEGVVRAADASAGVGTARLAIGIFGEARGDPDGGAGDAGEERAGARCLQGSRQLGRDQAKLSFARSAPDRTRVVRGILMDRPRRRWGPTSARRQFGRRGRRRTMIKYYSGFSGLVKRFSAHRNRTIPRPGCRMRHTQSAHLEIVPVLRVRRPSDPVIRRPNAVRRKSGAWPPLGMDASPQPDRP